jgi:hypothetical protein
MAVKPSLCICAHVYLDPFPHICHPILFQTPDQHVSLLPAEIATSSWEGEPVWEQYAEHFGSPTFMDQPVSAAFAGESSDLLFLFLILFNLSVVCSVLTRRVGMDSPLKQSQSAVPARRAAAGVSQAVCRRQLLWLSPAETD